MKAVAKIPSLSSIKLLKSTATKWQCSKKGSGKFKYFCILKQKVLWRINHLFCFHHTFEYLTEGNLLIWQSSGFYVCYNYMTVKFNHHFRIRLYNCSLYVCHKWMTVKFNQNFSLPLISVNLSCILHHQMLCGSQNWNRLHICYQWKGICLHHWEIRNNAL